MDVAGDPRDTDFNPRTREGCDFFIQLLKINHKNFNRRTREGCDALYILHALHTVNFNPRTREGCDSGKSDSDTKTTLISIHAPARGATVQESLMLLKLKNFNPRTREGCDWQIRQCHGK